MYQCRELLDKLTTTPIKVKIQCKEYRLYYSNGTLSNHTTISKCEGNSQARTNHHI